MVKIEAVSQSLRNAQQLPEETAAARKRFILLDLEPIIFKLVHPEDGEAWTLEKAERVTTQYKLFLLSKLDVSRSFYCANQRYR